MIRYLSVCSGVGGLDYGLERAGWQPVAMCEAAAYPRRVLARHWPELPCFVDLMTLRAPDLPGPVDAIAGGIPCQPFSTAGKQVGTDDPRHLWPHFLRLMLETGAGLGLIENVRGLLTAQKGWAFATILREAVAAGFTVEWQILAAGTLGAPHIRQRVFLVLRRDGWTWPGVAQVGMFGTSPWADIVPPSDGWPVSGRATVAGWVRTPWVYPHPAAWPWEAVQGEMVPTPAAGDAKATRNESAIRSPGAKGAHAGMTLTDWADPTNGGRKMLPTPAGADGDRESGTFGRGNQTLVGAARAMLPTPMAFSHGECNEAGTTSLERMVRGMTNGGDRGVRPVPTGMLPTPAARDWRDGRASDATMDRNARPLNEVVVQRHGGKLRPAPVEWMMGWPDGWTVPLGDSLRNAPPQAWTGWPACEWTTTEKEPHRRDRLKGCGNGVVGPVGERIGLDVLASVARLRRIA